MRVTLSPAAYAMRRVAAFDAIFAAAAPRAAKNVATCYVYATLILIYIRLPLRYAATFQRAAMISACQRCAMPPLRCQRRCRHTAFIRLPPPFIDFDDCFFFRCCRYAADYCFCYAMPLGWRFSSPLRRFFARCRHVYAITLFADVYEPMSFSLLLPDFTRAALHARVMFRLLIFAAAEMSRCCC